MTKHGHKSRTGGTKLHRAWTNMLTRCRNPNYASYERYGGRGITVCDRWLAFENFMEDVGEPPTDKHQLDRIDSDGNYEPGNTRWVTATEQARNRPSWVKLTYEKAQKIRRMRADGATCPAIGKAFGVSEHVVRSVVSGVSWTTE